ncbi:MAG: serine/threonine-protein kinase [Rubrivivax sp.]|nr:serine/threonine-protein kinase [Rubrivivax sp.]
MTPEDPEDDRTVIRPSGQTAMPPATGFQATEWSGGPGAAAMDKTQSAGAPPPHQDFGSGLPAGTRLGEFEITELVGEGGFGLVYSAHDHSLQRRVALKEYMPSSLAARAGGSQVQVKSQRHRETFEAGLKSFINEARLLASFDHPSLVKVYRFWEANGTAYMVMPFLDGATLKDVLRQMGSPPDEDWLRTVLGPLTEALLVIHAEQCYHRDIAPDNVMLMPVSNRWLLLDFGAARRVIGDMTQALTVILKPGYAPVEQYAEIPGMKQGPWTDVYALAAVVYFAIMGRTPPPSVGRLLNDTYVPLVQAAAGRYSERFLAAIDRALAVRPDERTQSIGEFRSDLGLGESGFVADSTRPMPPGTQMPTRPPQPTVAVSGVSPGSGFAATPAPRSAAAVSAPAAAAPTAARVAPGKGKGLMIGLGAVVLVVLGVGGYALLAPAPGPPPPAEQVASPAPAPATAALTAPVPAAPPPPAPTSFDPGQEFARVVQAQTAGFDVRVQTNKPSYRIGKDTLSFTVQAEREGYVYVFVYGADKALVRLYPTVSAGALRVRQGQVLKLPPPPDSFETTGPAGATDLLVMVSARQRDHGTLKPQREGQVLLFPTGPEAAALAAQYAGPGPAMAGSPVCPTAEPCADEYGAAHVRVEVVP